VKAGLLLAILLLCSPLALAKTQSIAGPKIYSNVHVAQSSSDLLGDELILIINGHDVQATLNEFQGGRYPTQRVLKGTLRGTTLRLRGKHEFGKIRISGTLAGGRLAAIVTDRHVGQAPKTRAIHLTLVKKCWYPTCGPPD
jgi:hypothetical protein